MVRKVDQDAEQKEARAIAAMLREQLVEPGVLEERASKRVEQRAAARETTYRETFLPYGSNLVETLDAMESSFAGGFLTNRPPANPEGSHNEDGGKSTVSPAHFSGGEDWFEVSLWVRWERPVRRDALTEADGLEKPGALASCWDSLRTALERAKEHATAEEEGSDTDGGDVFVWNDHNWLMRPKAAVTGGKGGTYRWVMDKDGITYMIANREEPLPQFANVRFRIGSLALMLSDAETLWRQVKADIDSLGGTIERSTLSRVDPCFDLPGVAVEPFKERLDDGRVISRARKDREFDAEGREVHHEGKRGARRCTSFYVGARSAKLTMCVYDKLLEVTTKRDEKKLAALIKYRWGNTLPAEATRVEFRLTREKLVELGIDSVDDWFRERANIVRYLVADWIRFIAEPIDDTSNHYHEAATWDVWTRVIESSGVVYGQASRAVRATKRVNVDFQQLAAQTCGTIASRIVYAHGVIRDKGEFLAKVFDVVEETINAREWSDFTKRQERKLRRFLASVPSGAINELGPRSFDLFWSEERRRAEVVG